MTALPLTVEFQKRPFVRPLMFWVAGILLYVCFPVQSLAALLPVIAAVFMLCVYLFEDRRRRSPVYYNRWLWGALFACITVFLAIQTTALTEQVLHVRLPENFFLRIAKTVQTYCLDKIDSLNLPDRHKAVIASITINYKLHLPYDVRAQFSVAGVAHILAVSGFHIGIMYGFVRICLSVFPMKDFAIRLVKCLISMLVIWLYACVSGLSACSVRAALMITIYIAGELLSRRPDSYNALAAACFLQLAYNPFWIFDVGFQLSYVAVFFILYLHRPISNLLAIRNPLLKFPWNALTVTASAQTGVFFIIFYYFGYASTFFLFTNLFLSIAAQVLIPLTMLWLMIPSGVPFIDAICRPVIEVLTRFMLHVVDTFASLPGSRLEVRFDLFTTIAAYASLILLLLYMRRRSYRLLIATLATTLLILGRLIILL